MTAQELYDVECDTSKQVLKNAQLKAYVERIPTFNDKTIVVFIEEFGHTHRIVMDNDGRDKITSNIKIGSETFELRIYLNLDKNDAYYGVQLDIFNIITDTMNYSSEGEITNYEFDEFIHCNINPTMELEYIKNDIINNVIKIKKTYAQICYMCDNLEKILK